MSPAKKTEEAPAAAVPAESTGKPGRPRKDAIPKVAKPEKPKRGRGRPKKRTFPWQKKAAADSAADAGKDSAAASSPEKK